MSKAGVLAGLCTLCVAAGAYAAVQRPTVTYQSANVSYIGAEGFTFNLNLEIHNPNAFAIPLGESTYVLKFGDVPILQGRARPIGSVPAGGVLPLTLPVSLTWQNVLGAEEVIRHNRGNIPYTLEGQLGFDMKMTQLLIFTQPVRVPLRYSGVLPVRELIKDPSLLLRSPAVARLAQIVIGQVFSQQTRPAPVRPQTAPPPPISQPRQPVAPPPEPSDVPSPR